MTSKAGSMDDLPLAAYSTGVIPDQSAEVTDAPGAFDESDSPGQSGRTISVPLEIGPSSELPASGDPLDPLMAAAPTSTIAARLPALPAMPAMPAMPALPDWLAHPRANVRDPRLLLSGVVAIGVVLLALSLLGGGGRPSGLVGAGASPSALAGPGTTQAPGGNASVEVAGTGVSATLGLAVVAAAAPVAAGSVSSTWNDALGNALALEGPVSAGTRTTAADFVLRWTVIVKAAPVTFTSRAGECTVGMAVKPEMVSGSFVCKKVKSDDGKYVVGARGTYRT
jgi:hypothetical protein